VSTAEPVAAEGLAASKAEYLVSYGFRHILREDVLALFPERALNLHISLLPWNRGADPNLWSFLEDTPKGVTIHRLDKGVDTGDILVQREVAIPGDATLRTSYELLQESIRCLFCENWPRLKAGELRPRPQTGPATAHRTKDKLPHLGALRLGMDTPVEEIAAYGRSKGLGR
jgi:methionyl-tRNA formyltransferase